MRVIVCAVALIGLVPVLAGAQTAPPASGPAHAAVDITSADLQAALKVGMAALTPGVSVSDRNISLADTPAHRFSERVLLLALTDTSIVLASFLAALPIRLKLNTEFTLYFAAAKVLRC